MPRKPARRITKSHFARIIRAARQEGCTVVEIRNGDGSIERSPLELELEGFIYFIGYENWVKIGFATEIEARIRGLQSASPQKLEIFYFERGSMRDERQYHRQFSEHRAHGEWFRREGSLVAWLENRIKTHDELASP